MVDCSVNKKRVHCHPFSHHTMIPRKELSLCIAFMMALLTSLFFVLSQNFNGIFIIEPDWLDSELHAEFESLWLRSLARPLCMVLVVGTNVDLQGEPATMAQDWPNCLFRITSSASPKSPPGPPYNFYFEPFRLSAQNEGFVPHQDEGQTLRPVVRVTPYLKSLEQNRVAAIIVRVLSEADVNTFRELLQYSHLFLDLLMVVQFCSGHNHTTQIDNEHPATSQVHTLLHSFGYVIGGALPRASNNNNQTAENSASDCLERGYFQQKKVSNETRAYYPRMPKRFASATGTGRTANAMILDAAGVLEAKKARRTFVLPESVYGSGLASLMYNVTQIAELYGEPNQFLSFDDLTTVPTLGWCPKTMSHCFSIDNTVNCLSVNCSSSGCLQYLPPLWRASVWQPHAPAMANFRPCNGVHSLSSENDGLLSVYMDGDVLFWQRNPIPNEERAKQHPCPVYNLEAYEKAGWMSPSEVAVDLAKRLLEIAYEQMEQDWKTTSEHWRVLGVHMRLTDYDFITQPHEWTDAWRAVSDQIIQQHNQHNPTKHVAFHGAFVCSDDPGNPRFAELINTLKQAGTSILGCTEHVQTGVSGFDMTVIQTLLTRVDCFIGLSFSTFSWRIQARRVLEGRDANCDRHLRSVWTF